MATFFDASRAFKRIYNISKALRFEGDKVASKTLSETRKEIKANTPVRYTGETRRAWVTERRGMGSYRTFNTTNTAWFLEHGTQAHGPRTKKALFIPINKHAFFVYRANTFPPLAKDEDYILRAWVKGIDARKIATRRIVFAATLGRANLAKMLQKL